MMMCSLKTKKQSLTWIIPGHPSSPTTPILTRNTKLPVPGSLSPKKDILLSMRISDGTNEQHALSLIHLPHAGRQLLQREISHKAQAQH